MNGINMRMAAIAGGIVVAAAVALLLLSGCTPTGSAGTVMAGRNVYTAQFAQSPWEYTAYLSKQIETAANQMSTQLTIAKSVKDGAYPAQDAICRAQEALRVIGEAITGVGSMQPPDGYEQDRLEALRLMRNSESSIDAYIQALEEGSSLDGAMALIQADMSAMTGAFNVYWK